MQNLNEITKAAISSGSKRQLIEFKNKLHNDLSTLKKFDTANSAMREIVEFRTEATDSLIKCIDERLQFFKDNPEAGYQRELTDDE